MVTTLSTNSTVTAPKIRFHGYYLTPAQLNAYLDASTKKRARLVVQYKQRGTFLGIAGDLASWRERWLTRVTR